MDANTKVAEPAGRGDVSIAIAVEEPSTEQLPAAAAVANGVGGSDKSSSSSTYPSKNGEGKKGGGEGKGKEGGEEEESRHRRLRSYRLESIPKWVRAVNSEAYSPRYISIGPIHRPSKDDVNNPLHCTALKEDYLRRLSALMHFNKDGCLDDLTKMEDETRRFYAQDFKGTIKATEWSEMLLLDGCFVIMLLLDFNLGIEAPGLKLPKWVWSVLKMDLILLENQLPFSVLKCIMRFVLPGKGKLSDHKVSEYLTGLVIYYWVWRVRDYHVFSNEVKKLHDNFGKVEHLLHLYHLAHYRMIYGYSKDHNDDLIVAFIWKTRSAICYIPILAMKLISWPCIKLCQFADAEEKQREKEKRMMKNKKKMMKKVQSKEDEDEDDDDEEMELEDDENNIPSATQVHNLGINLRRTKHLRLAPKSKYEVGINAMDNNTLDIPRLVVSSPEEPLLHNLIAWEHATHDDEYDEKLHFTKYAFLMYNLINDTQDIALLQQKGILLNKLGTDDEVIAYFKKLVQWTSWEPKRTITTSQTRREMVCNKVMNCWSGKSSSGAESSKIDQVMELLKHRVEQEEYRYWAEVKKYFDSPLQVILVVISFLLFVSTVLPAIMSVHITK